MKFKDNEAIKVLFRESDGRLWSCHGGSYEWTLGEWTPEVPELKLGVQGYHLTRNPQAWWWRDPRTHAFLAEYKDPVDGQFDDSWKSRVSVGSCRLMRELTDTELAESRVFLRGSHRVANTGLNGQVLVGGSAEVEVSGNSWVEAFGTARILASGNSRVSVADKVKVTSVPGVLIFPAIGFSGEILGGGYVAP